jgi:hypothetical protein
MFTGNDCDGGGKSRFFTLCAHPSGRTVGGTSWVIRQGKRVIPVVIWSISVCPLHCCLILVNRYNGSSLYG